MGSKFANFEVTFSNKTNKLAPKKIVIGLATFKRPQMLDKTLKSLAAQEIPEGVVVELVLVDNDAERSSFPVFEAFSRMAPFQVHFFCEENKGIVSARNRIVEEALGLQADFLGFIDDDEAAAPDWLGQLYRGLTKYEADVVPGFSLQKLPESAPEWIVKGNFFKLSSYPTGTLRKSASTRNILFDLKKLCGEWGLRFHPALNMTGSSDTFFFEEAHLKGAKIVWIAEAVVEEEIPASRLNSGWLMARWFRAGNSRVIRQKLRQGRFYGLLMFPFAFLALTWGVILCLITLPLAKHVRIKKRRYFCEHLGRLSATVGYKYPEYRQKHGY